jgi:hypothetical protein
MKVFAAVNLPTDIPSWVTREDFHRYFDQTDFLNRKVRDVQAAYLKNWFHTSDDGSTHFSIPVVGALNKSTDLIGGRHRLAVLLPHLADLPIAFATGQLQSEARRFLETIPRRPLNLAVPLWIPDLPVRGTLPWLGARDA